MTTPTSAAAPLPAARPVEEHSVIFMPISATAPVPAARPVEEHSA